MSALIFGVGVGLFIIILLWAVALLLCLVSLRAQRNIGLAGILAAGLISAFLLVLPHDSPTSDLSEPEKIYDHFFIWRVLLIVFLGLCTVAGGITYVYTHLMEPKYAKPVFKQPLKLE